MTMNLQSTRSIFGCAELGGGCGGVGHFEVP